MKILVCDDNLAFAESLKQKIQNILSGKCADIEITVTDDSASLCNNPFRYDIAFLDIEMPRKNGLETAKALYSINSQLLIFIITSFDKYLDDAMDLNIFRYIQKPVDEKRLKDSIEKALRILDLSFVECCVLPEKFIIKFPVKEIEYVEVCGKGTKIVTKSDVFRNGNNIEYWNQKLASAMFFRIHKSFIVNLNYIHEYRKDCVIVIGGDCLPVAYRTRTKFKKYFFDYIGD